MFVSRYDTLLHVSIRTSVCCIHKHYGSRVLDLSRHAKGVVMFSDSVIDVPYFARSSLSWAEMRLPARSDTVAYACIVIPPLSAVFPPDEKCPSDALRSRAGWRS